jgi:hypothetical protein
VSSASCAASVRLVEASNQLASCVRDLGANDGCVSRYRDVRDAFDVYSDTTVSVARACH